MSVPVVFILDLQKSLVDFWLVFFLNDFIKTQKISLVIKHRLLECLLSLSWLFFRGLLRLWLAISLRILFLFRWWFRVAARDSRGRFGLFIGRSRLFIPFLWFLRLFRFLILANQILNNFLRLGESLFLVWRRLCTFPVLQKFSLRVRIFLVLLIQLLLVSLFLLVHL